MKTSFIISLIMLGLLPVKHAQGQHAVNEDRFSGYAFILDQDFLAPWTNEDRNYTMGVGITFTGSAFANLPTSWVTRKLSDAFGHEKLLLTKHELSLVGNAFTPEDLTAELPVIGDRPYGSLVGLSTRRLIVPIENNPEAGPRYRTAIRTEFIIGALGLGVAEFIQTEIHQFLRSLNMPDNPDPLGWDNQISDGGEFTLLLRASYERRWLVRFRCGSDMDSYCSENPPLGTRKLFESTWFWDTHVGFNTSVSAGLRFRLGGFTTEFWDFNSGTMNPIAQGVENPRSRRWEFFFMGAASGRLVAYNAMLQGQFRGSVYTLDARDINRALFEFQFGPVLNIPLFKTNRLGIAYLFSGRTAEFSGPFARTHTWGSLHFSVGRPARTGI